MNIDFNVSEILQLIEVKGVFGSYLFLPYPGNDEAKSNFKLDDLVKSLAELRQGGQSGQAGSKKVLMFLFATPCKDGVSKANNEWVE